MSCLSHSWAGAIPISIWNASKIIKIEPPLEADLEEKERLAKIINFRNSFIFNVKGLLSDFVNLKVSCNKDLTFNKLEIKFNNVPVQKEKIEVTAIDKMTLKIKFDWSKLDGFHIFDVFTVLIDYDEASCQFSFKIIEKTPRAFIKKNHLHEPDNKESQLLRILFQKKFRVTDDMSLSETALLTEISNYYKMSLPERLASQQHFEMLRHAIKIERFEEFESLTLLDVKLKQLGKHNSYYFEYKSNLFKNLDENTKDFSLEIMTMDKYKQKQCPMIFQVTNHNIPTGKNIGSVSFKSEQKFNIDTLYYICIIPNSVTFKACLSALLLLKEYKMQGFFNNFESTQLTPYAVPTVTVFCQQKRKPQELEYFNEKIKTNQEQMLAVKQILNRTDISYPFVVFGPPGTGKTTVIVESIAQIIKRNENARILVTSQSNYACDEIGVRLLKHIPRGKIYRHYSKSCVPRKDQIHQELLKISNMSDIYFKDKISVDQFYHFNVIIVTLVSSANFMEEMPKLYFDYIFIDEAGAANEPEILIPITGFAMDLQSARLKANVILLGDHKQLGPVVKSEFADNLGLGVSLLERIMETKHYKNDDSKYKVQLLDNYRSHPKILEIPNKLFYNSMLRSKILKEDADFAVGWNLLPNKEIPIILHSVSGFCSQEPISNSYFNHKEIDKVKLYVNSLLRQGINGREIQESDIGIVAPYRAQVKWLKRKFCDRKGIEIGTAELYQGREKKIIIMSTVKSNRCSVGFLANQKRLNVMLTRAKNLLIVVCDPSVLLKDPNWRIFIEFCVKNKVCAGGEIKLQGKIENSAACYENGEKVTELNTTVAEKIGQKRKAEEMQEKIKEEVKRIKLDGDNKNSSDNLRQSHKPNENDIARKNLYNLIGTLENVRCPYQNIISGEGTSIISKEEVPTSIILEPNIIKKKVAGNFEDNQKLENSPVIIIDKNEMHTEKRKKSSQKPDSDCLRITRSKSKTLLDASIKKSCSSESLNINSKISSAKSQNNQHSKPGTPERNQDLQKSYAKSDASTKIDYENGHQESTQKSESDSTRMTRSKSKILINATNGKLKSSVLNKLEVPAVVERNVKKANLRKYSTRTQQSS